MDVQIGGRQIGRCLVGPFDQTQGRGAEIFCKAAIEKFFRTFETIKIKVI